MKRVLLVEDNLGDARLAEEMLGESTAFEVDILCVGRLSQAINVLQEQPIELILLDLSLPDSHGLEGLKQLQELSPDAPIIVLSGMDDRKLALEAVKHGAQDYLLKGSMNADALTRVIQYSIERKSAEIRYRSLIVNIPGVVYCCQNDAAWSMLFMSTPFNDMTGYTPEEFSGAFGCRYVELIHPDDRESVIQSIVGSVARHEPYSVEYRIRHKDNTYRWVLDRGKGVRKTNGAVPSRDGVLFDITEQKILEERVRKTEDQLRRTRQVAALGNLASGIAHDFNNLLTAINGFSDLGLNELSPESRAHTHLMQIRKASTRAMTITQQLLSLGQANVQEKTFVDLNLMIGEMERLIRLVIGPHRRVEIQTEALLGRVKVNASQIEQALFVLAMNLMEERDVNEHLRIETMSWDVTKEEAEQFGFIFGGPHVVVKLRAALHGQVLSSENQSLPSMVNSEAENESGFGVKGVLNLVNQNHGYFLVVRNDCVVREYVIVLPRTEVSQDALVFHDTSLAAHRTGTETVLLVDDEVSVRLFIREVLETNGYRVLEASGGQQAIQLSEQSSEKIHLMIADEVMPGMSGGETAERVVTHRPQLRVLPMSTSKPTRYSDKELFLLKPFTTETLLKHVGAALDQNHERLVKLGV